MLKILIVDDDVSITELMKALLKMEGYEPITVNDSLQAIDIAKSVNPDLITLDLMMPGLTGFELCEMMTKDPLMRPLPSPRSKIKLHKYLTNPCLSSVKERLSK